jgi:hypothetical protein
MKNLISVSAVLALVVAATAMPLPVAALDLGGSVDRVSKGLSKTVDKVTDTLGGDGGSTSSSSTGGTSTAGTSGGSTPGGTTAGTSGGGVASASASVGKSGVKAKIGSSLLGGTQVTVGALNPTGEAQIGVQIGSARVGAAVLSNRQLATLRIDANPPGTGNVALPGGSAGSGNGGVVGVTPDYARKLLATLNRSEELILMQRCAMILRSPKAFDAELVLLCRLVAQL